jgi:hypothetical protein
MPDFVTDAGHGVTFPLMQVGSRSTETVNDFDTSRFLIGAGRLKHHAEAAFCKAPSGLGFVKYLLYYVDI